jgi:putative membrane protein
MHSPRKGAVSFGRLSLPGTACPVVFFSHETHPQMASQRDRLAGGGVSLFGVVVTSFTGALIAAAVLGALNMVVRPILVLLTLPVTLVTLGLFLFVVNALMFWAAASLVSGLNVTGFGAALIGSLIYSVLQLAIEFVLERLFLNK